MALEYWARSTETPVEVGQQYYVGVWVKDNLLGGSTPGWLNFSNQPGGSAFWQQIVIPNDGDWHYVEGLTAAIPAGITHGRFGMISNPGADYLFDDGYVGLTSQIPEPMTLGLLGLGGLFMRRRKS
jgi:hypothetical protein